MDIFICRGGCEESLERTSVFIDVVAGKAWNGQQYLKLFLRGKPRMDITVYKCGFGESLERH